MRLPSGGILMGRGSKLYLRAAGSDPSWTEIADLSRDGIRNITRLAVSPSVDKLVVVADHQSG